jgi:hypothetical protein
MPTNRFGELNTQPLYNATGRLERGESVPRQQWTSPNAGVRKDFSGGQYPLSGKSPFTDLAYLADPWNVANRNLRPKSTRGGGGGGGGDSDGSGPGSGGLTQNLYFGAPQFASQEQQTAKNGLGTNPAQGDAMFAPQEQQTASTPNARAPRAPRTEEQKAATRELRAQKKAANPAYGKKNPNRTQAPKKPRSKPATQQPSTGSVVQGNQGTQTQLHAPTVNNTFGKPGSPGAGFLPNMSGANFENVANNR